MVATNGRTVTVFGGTGFLGCRIVWHLRCRGFPVRVASRHPDRRARLFFPDGPQLRRAAAEMIAASPCGRVVEIDRSHSPFFSAPEELACVLGSLAMLKLGNCIQSSWQKFKISAQSVYRTF
jgi:nucleoside-diphosphate-sugar epimerase